jgi:MoxR-like ATPase
MKTKRVMTKAVQTTPVLFGPAASILEAARSVAARTNPLRLLFDGDPGIGKTALADALAGEVAVSPFAIESVNGQSLSVDRVRDWRERSLFGNLFSPWTVKRIDEIDQMSSSAVSEMLTYLDTLPARHAVIATTNEFAKLRAQTKGRLESRFIRLPVEGPGIADTAAQLVARFRIRQDQADAIARGSVPEGLLDGCNVRAAFNDARALLAIRGAGKGRKAA